MSPAHPEPNGSVVGCQYNCRDAYYCIAPEDCAAHRARVAAFVRDASLPEEPMGVLTTTDGPECDVNLAGLTPETATAFAKAMNGTRPVLKCDCCGVTADVRTGVLGGIHWCGGAFRLTSDPIPPSYDELAAQLTEARDTIKRLNRRCQTAEAGVIAKAEAVGQGNLSRIFTRALAATYREQLTECEAKLAASEAREVALRKEMTVLRVAIGRAIARLPELSDRVGVEAKGGAGSIGTDAGEAFNALRERAGIVFTEDGFRLTDERWQVAWVPDALPRPCNGSLEEVNRFMENAMTRFTAGAGNLPEWQVLAKAVQDYEWALITRRDMIRSAPTTPPEQTPQ